MTRYAPLHKLDATTTLVVALAESACKRAIAFDRAGRPGRAEYEIARAGLRIARVVRDDYSVDVLGQLRLFEPFHDRRRGDVGALRDGGAA